MKNIKNEDLSNVCLEILKEVSNLEKFTNDNLEDFIKHIEMLNLLINKKNINVLKELVKNFIKSQLQGINFSFTVTTDALLEEKVDNKFKTIGF